MNSTVRIIDAATVTAFGDGVDPLWQGLREGRSAIRPFERFAADNYLAREAAAVPGLTWEKDRSQADHLLDRILAGLRVAPPADCRLLTATTKGGIDALERLRRGTAETTDGLLLGQLPEKVAARCGLRDGGVNISAACASSTIALARGAAMIDSGQAAAVLVCCLDLLSEFVFSGFSALQGLSSRAARPFDRGRDGLSMGEGGAVLLLANAAWAEKNGYRPLATIAGWGVANDANHITAPARDGSGLVRAMEQALGKAGVDPGEIAAVSAHGTATVYNDAMELTALRRVFADRPLPVHSVKGAIGHTLGAAGGIETALAVRMLAEETMPPTVGFQDPEEGAEERVSARAQGIEGDYLLSTNSGFGGVNAVLVMGKADKG